MVGVACIIFSNSKLGQVISSINHLNLFCHLELIVVVFVSE